VIAQLAAAYHWQPSEIRRLTLEECTEYLDIALDMGLLGKA